MDPDAPEGAGVGSGAHPASSLPPSGSARICALDRDPLLPPHCACCNQPAAESLVERAWGAPSVIVPYCADCHRHASAERTRVLSISLASVLLTVSAAAALPLAWEWIPWPAHLAATLCAGALPGALQLVRRTRPLAGHSTRTRAAWWHSRAELVATHPQWAAELARLNQAELRPFAARAPARSAYTWVWLVLGIAMFGFARYASFARVRLINLTAAPFLVWVDDRYLGLVEPTSFESATAGRELTVPTGSRKTRIVSDEGRPVFEGTILVVSFSEHLLAPGATGYCFWLETTHYGRAATQPNTVQALTGPGPFWVVHTAIDRWFMPNPDAAGEARSTGGKLVALRQARCDEQPQPLRNANR